MEFLEDFPRALGRSFVKIPSQKGSHMPGKHRFGLLYFPKWADLDAPLIKKKYYQSQPRSRQQRFHQDDLVISPPMEEGFLEFLDNLGWVCKRGISESWKSSDGSPYFCTKGRHPITWCLHTRETKAPEINPRAWRKSWILLGKKIKRGTSIGISGNSRGQWFELSKLMLKKEKSRHLAKKNMSTECYWSSRAVTVASIANKSWLGNWNHFQLEYAASGRLDNKDRKKLIPENGARSVRLGLITCKDWIFGRNGFGEKFDVVP